MADRRRLRLAFGLVAAAPAVFGQAPWTPPNPEIIRKNVNEVHLTFTVTDSKGRFVSGLTQDNFSILDNGVPPSRLSAFQAVTDRSLRLCVVLDSSGSISRRVRFEQDVATAFMKQVIRPGKDKACVINFTSRPVVVQEFTDDLEKLDVAVRRSASTGDTAVWDAVRFAAEMIDNQNPADDARRVIVLLGDGDDNGSVISVRDAIDSALSRDVVVHAVYVFRRDGFGMLHQLASATGGRFWWGNNAQQLAAGMADIEQSLRSQYFVAYEPAGDLLPGSFRTIEMNSRSVDGSIAYRNGYYVPRTAISSARDRRLP